VDVIVDEAELHDPHQATLVGPPDRFEQPPPQLLLAEPAPLVAHPQRHQHGLAPRLHATHPMPDLRPRRYPLATGATPPPTSGGDLDLELNRLPGALLRHAR
jgi:hypothetical protein